MALTIGYSTNITVILAQSSSAAISETGTSGLTSAESAQLMKVMTVSKFLALK